LQVGFGLRDIKDFPQIIKKIISVLPDGRKIGVLWNNVDFFYSNF
jgi:hypothetical protein